MAEGCIKYICNRTYSTISETANIIEINNARTLLKKYGMIGEYSSGICYGNISQRLEKNKFIITATRTGSFEKLLPNHFSIVNDFSIDCNTINCIGEFNASSEALSHAAIYEVLPRCNSVIHIHHREMWEKLLNKVPTVDDSSECGTPQIANAIKSIVASEVQTGSGIIALAGHFEGVISFGDTIDCTLGIIIEHF